MSTSSSPQPTNRMSYPLTRSKSARSTPEEITVRSVVGDELRNAPSAYPAAITTRQASDRPDLLPRSQPIEHAPAMNGKPFLEHARSERRRELDAASRDKPSRPHA